MTEEATTNSQNTISNNQTNDKLSQENISQENKKRYNHQLIHLIGKLVAKIPLVSKKDIEEDNSTHKAGTCNLVSFLTIKSQDEQAKIITKHKIQDNNLKKWQRKKLYSIVYNTHLSLIKGHQPKDYSLTTQENVGETFWEYKKKHDLTSARRIYIMTKLNGMINTNDLLSPLLRWCKNHQHEDIADVSKYEEMLKVYAEYIDSLTFEKNETTKEYTNRAKLFQKVVCSMYYDRVLLNLQDRKSNNICLSSQLYDEKDSILPNINDEIFIDIDTEDINGFRFMFDFSFNPEDEKERLKIVEIWTQHLKKMVDKIDNNLKTGYYKRRLLVNPDELLKTSIQNFVMCGFYDKDKMTSCIYNHLSRAINYWKKLLRDKNFDNPECRKLTKLAIKNFQRCITTYWTELTKTSVLFGQKMEDEIKSKIEEREKDLRVAIDKIAHGDAWGIDIIMEN